MRLRRWKLRVSNFFTTDSNGLVKVQNASLTPATVFFLKLTPAMDFFFLDRVQPWIMFHQLAETSKSQIYTGDESVAELAKGWLTHCQNQHLSCSKHLEMDWYPTRLLDVSLDPVRLRISSEGQISGPHATLSHCWGTERF